MGQGYLLDTNAVIDYMGGKLPIGAIQKVNQIINNGFYISPVVKIEALGFNGLLADMQKLEALLDFGNMVYIDDLIIQKTIDIRKVRKIKLGDALIAATAIGYNYILLSRNLTDFKNITGLTIIDPHTL